MTPIKLAWLSLSRHRFTTLIAVIAIALSVACGGLLLRLYQLSESRFASLGAGGDAVIGAKAGGIEILLGSLNGEGQFPDFLPMKLFETLRSQQNIQFEDGHTAKPASIRSIVPFVYFAKWGDDRVIGTDESFFKRSSHPLNLSEGHIFSQLNEVVVGSAIAKSKGLKIGDTIMAQAWLGDVLPAQLALRVSGILSPTHSQWDREIFGSYEQAQASFYQHPEYLNPRSIWGPAVLHYFLVDLEPNGFASLEALVNRRTVGQIVRVEEQKERLQELTGIGHDVGVFVILFVISLGGLTVASMLVSRFEGMATQIAVLRALGYSKAELAAWLLWEGLLLAVFGILLGAVLDFAALPWLRDILGTALPPAELVSTSIVESSPIWLIALIAVAISVFIPMWQMSRQNAHDALKGL